MATDEQREPLAYLHDIQESIEHIEAYTQPHTFESFVRDQQIQDAVVRRIEIIGEAVKQLPLAIRHTYPEIPWRDVAGMRDILIHEYYRVDLPTAWEVAIRDLPKLKRQIQNLIRHITMNDNKNSKK
ncbi:MAG TPA: hypothetical protein DCY48_01340 [Candidatus Magasanikbacteria bacterium]|nr:MAG: hypothetical protein A3I74_03805 [Candidatus Magasanikbacteria bacterium RIFCSPLOWO2_02_FULL_47_16]OGH79292.1 MAG: hypothetical protein A3C10_04345 [Candidatus Magasanikbacteria bacterium RIFCSPHIGHO2_02_FULL_48_18]OGH82222.1 MAG: hypothetical protein A3G08_00985 [Candidatus Magasanikbacteria bacterium RIFCSPLOWO2_12_FULL_47_9b]HAZ28402.1 hypothetical protein [Candidatus Magasanikbacteria bacterium]